MMLTSSRRSVTASTPTAGVPKLLRCLLLRALRGRELAITGKSQNVVPSVSPHGPGAESLD